ncbi:protein-L-isoaspartate(D-aspartate) O-methyltransferase [Aurantimonas sp. A2-1-M11]|uniref:protein-L-isoaspartate(D-aspartate) O-methyltransferase n=1 Tax=Aurantimonas sp. A2-1-M11 TaxID=3113712 RepID=UPI002F927209
MATDVQSATRDREDLAAFLLALRSERITDPRLLEAVESVPRRLFLPEGVVNAYENRSAPIACGETMHGALASVRLVAALEVQPSHRVLEIGTGSGYVTALLARLGAHVSSFDRYRGLVDAAGRRLRDIGITNISLFFEDGRDGFAGGAPFDRVIVHAAFASVPRQFLDQLGAHATMICAIGPGDGAQELLRLRKVGSRFEREPLGTVRYQPLAFGKADVL